MNSIAWNEHNRTTFFLTRCEKYASICTRTRRSMCLFFGGWAKGGTQKWLMLIYKFVNTSFYHNNWRCLPAKLLFYHTYINTYGCVRKRTYKLHRIRKLDRALGGGVSNMCTLRTLPCARSHLSMCMLPVEHVHTYTWAYAHLHLSICTPVKHMHAYTSAHAHF